MGGGGVRISQEAFEELVIENMEDLGMDPGEALQDAVDTLTLQGVDLSGIVQCVPGQGYANDHPVVHSLDSLRHLLDSKALDSQDLLPLLHNLTALSNFTATDRATNLAIAAKKGGIELLTSLSSKIVTSRSANHHLTLSTLNALACLLHDVPSAEIFLKHGGPSAIMDILQFSGENLDVLNACFSVVSAAATGNEILKESFMNLKIEERIIHIMKTHSKGSIPSLYDAIRVLLTSDDNCVVASQVNGYARKFAESGVAEALVQSLAEGISSASLVSASVALKAVAVNDEICRSVAEKGGIDSILRCIDDSGKQRNKTVARTCCSLLSKLAGSDTNKLAIAEKGGMDRLIQLSNIFYDDPSVLQEVMYLFSVLSLRSPDHATRAVEAGAGELAVKAMQKFPTASQLQRNACLMVRNLVVRNPENRQVLLILKVILLNNGIETIIRKARENHESCEAAAADALRDLGIANYKS
ncbi:Armadillo repeat-containing protein [Drosera capensis]